MVSKIFSYIKRIFEWIWAGKYYFLILAVFIITGLSIKSSLFYNEKFHAKVFSYFFAIVGFVILFIKLVLDAKKYSQHKPKTFVNYLRSFPGWRPIIVELPCAELNLSINSIEAKVDISPKATIEQKVDWLIGQLECANNKIKEIDGREENNTKLIKKEMNKLENEFKKENEALHATLAGHIVGSYDLTLLGLFLTFCATVLRIFM